MRRRITPAKRIQRASMLFAPGLVHHAKLSTSLARAMTVVRAYRHRNRTKTALRTTLFAVDRATFLKCAASLILLKTPSPGWAFGWSMVSPAKTAMASAKRRI
ncbi:hypothetical protein KCP69_10265 [Salmonella enterica subsp. enterica]|nr:hypothetical protein KCP69_10265 [Salmonella enterica subsp. enterica]